MADNSKIASNPSPAPFAKPSVDKSDWIYVEVPDTDLLGEPHTGVSINFEQFGPGKHFVDPVKGGEIKRLVEQRLRSDMRVMQPGQDQKALEIMRRNGKHVPNQV